MEKNKIIEFFFERTIENYIKDILGINTNYYVNYNFFTTKNEIIVNCDDVMLNRFVVIPIKKKDFLNYFINGGQTT